MIVEQVYIFGWSILVGAILGLLFDLFRGLRWPGIRNIWVYVQDIIFWIITAIIIIISSFFINQGEIRGYMLLGYALGAAFYLILFSHYVLSFLKMVNETVRKLIKKGKNKKSKQEN